MKNKLDSDKKDGVICTCGHQLVSAQELQSIEKDQTMSFLDKQKYVADLIIERSEHFHKPKIFPK